ncbi:Hypothetical predicted protein [Olea europaea subsp. europaea]|uniref:Uncharacterized protein n=1 Tax=Olea europaea subsp. europaea TaxID=158383 RepID=A0A8S0SY87_OLEEU|nr:Hypothetical predicted protein [Olea europaea subsp. europaea]
MNTTTARHHYHQSPHRNAPVKTIYQQAPPKKPIATRSRKPKNPQTNGSKIERTVAELVAKPPNLPWVAMNGSPSLGRDEMQRLSVRPPVEMGPNLGPRRCIHYPSPPRWCWCRCRCRCRIAASLVSPLSWTETGLEERD